MKDLSDKCASVQIKLGIDDPRWKQLFDNDKGLYGFVLESNIALLEELLESGHGGGNWRRLIFTELSTLKAPKDKP